MFYDKQPVGKQENYKNMLAIVGCLSNLFSDSDRPMLNYRAHENIFCKYFDAINLAREDCSADAKYDSLGIGLKTWVQSDSQKVAEFGRLRSSYANFEGLELVKTISEYRNDRIRVTMNLHGLSDMVYHIVKRIPGAMLIYETAFDQIDIDNINLITNRGKANTTYFTDGKHTYFFNSAKNTLYMQFDDMDQLDKIDVNICADPYEVLKSLAPQLISGTELNSDSVPQPTPANVPALSNSFGYAKGEPDMAQNQLCLRLYSSRNGKGKYVSDKSGLNQWNGYRTVKDKNGNLIKSYVRNADELYIPYPSVDRQRKTFFPPRDTPFELTLPNGRVIRAKVCQQDGKAIMSCPNSELGHWLLRDVFELPEGTKVTYDMLKTFGIDSVIFTKRTDGQYSIDFCKLGTYEKFYHIHDEDAVFDGEAMEDDSLETEPSEE